MPLPLEGLLVVSMEQAVAAPLASRHLADLGARVVKIERPGVGDFARDYDRHVNGLSTYFVWANRNKESVAVDTKDPRGREVIERLVAKADVFIQNLAPGAAARQGLGAAELVGRYPRIVACDLTGFGDSGPYADRRAYDLVVQAEAASIAITGTPDAPAKPGVAVADIGAAMYCHSSVLAALLGRERHGVGAAISVSLFDAMSEWMNYSLYFNRFSGQKHVPHGVGHPAIVPYGGFETSDGHTVVLGCQNDREWARLAADVLGRPDLADHADYLGLPNRVARRDEVHAIVGDAIGRLTYDEAAAALDAAGIANGRLNSVDDWLAHPQLSARDRWREVGSPVGPLPAILPPPVSPGWDLRMDPVPGLGEHTDAVLAELGYDAAAIADLHTHGVV